MEWNLFVKLRDGELTFDQVRARINALHFGLHYKVLDDLKPVLSESIYQGREEDERYYKKMYGIEHARKGNGAADDDIPLDKILGPKEPWQYNKKCLKSLFNNSKQKKEKDRAKTVWRVEVQRKK